MTKAEAISHIKDVICENNTIKPNMVVFEQEKEALCMAIEALTRMGYVQETVNCILNTCKSNQIADIAMRNAAKFVQNAIDGSCPDFEKIPKAQPCEDAVSRADVIRITTETGALETQSRVEALPSVQPTSTPCEYAEDCKKMKFEPCDAVSREAVLNYIRDNYRRWFINDDAFMQCVNGIKDFISVTPKQRTGKWAKTGQSYVIPNRFRNYCCSECGWELDKHIRVEPHYCPNCGTKMER